MALWRSERTVHGEPVSRRFSAQSEAPVADHSRTARDHKAGDGNANSGEEDMPLDVARRAPEVYNRANAQLTCLGSQAMRTNLLDEIEPRGVCKSFGRMSADAEGRYRETARKEIEVWKQQRPSRVMAALDKPAQFLGYPIRKALETERGRQLLARVIGAFLDAGTWRFSPEAVLDTYRKRGYSVGSLADIRLRVPLRTMDDEAKKHWIAGTAVLTVEGGIVGPAMAAAATAAGSAAAAAAVASGGSAAPAAAAAGLAVVASAAAAETVFLISFCCRRLASIAACYGYDVRDDCREPRGEGNRAS